jgi:uncharacterized protein YprB with RNaseH-like and TPR domain
MNLKERLSVIRIEKGVTSSPKRISHWFPSEWQRICPFVWGRTVDIPFDRMVSVVFPHLMRRDAMRSEKDDSDSISMDRIAFFDLETTGLSGGSGTLAFLATVGHFEGCDLLLQQTFLEDFPGEADFLSIVRDQLANAEWVVSYNGMTFDTPILQSRCVMNRISVPLFRQIDILYDCRRFWSSSTESCTLHSMEMRVLKKQRESDIPGALVPSVWLNYVKTESRTQEQNARISLVWEHNLEDVLSLARLFLCIEAIYRKPSEALEQFGVDPSGFAQRLIKIERYHEARALLLQVLNTSGEQTIARNSRVRALRLLAWIARRDRDRDLFVKAVLAMDDESLYGCVAKAKLFEHIQKDFESALYWARKAEQIAKADTELMQKTDTWNTILSNLQHRIIRLERRAGRSSGSHSPNR